MPPVLQLVLELAAIIAVIALVTWAVTKSGVNALVAVVLVGIAALITFVYQYTQNYHNDHWATCHVTKADIKPNSGDKGGGTYRVYTDNCGTLRNTDARFRGKWDSADVWQQIEPGKTYRLHLAGTRFAFWSWFPNIIEVQNAS